MQIVELQEIIEEQNWMTFLSKIQHLQKGYWIKNNWDKVFKNGPSKMCGRQRLKNMKWYDFLKAPFHKFSTNGSLLNTSPQLFLNLLKCFHDFLNKNIWLTRLVPKPPKAFSWCPESDGPSFVNQHHQVTWDLKWLKSDKLWIF